MVVLMLPNVPIGIRDLPMANHQPRRPDEERLLGSHSRAAVAFDARVLPNPTDRDSTRTNLGAGEDPPASERSKWRVNGEWFKSQKPFRPGIRWNPGPDLSG